MSRRNWFLRLAILSTVLALLGLPLVASAAWPPADGADMSKPENWPNDGGFAQGSTDADGKFWISGGEWNQWSFMPAGKPGSQEWPTGRRGLMSQRLRSGHQATPWALNQASVRLKPSCAGSAR